MNEVEEFYDSYSEIEWGRLERHRVEFDITKRYLEKYIRKKSTILDVGGGPGRYSIFLAQQDHEVTLLDLSSKNIKMARQKAAENKVEIKEYIHANALELSAKAPGVFDVVLGMGPLYHLVAEADRIKVIQECLLKLKKGGLLFVSFISAYAPLIDCIKKHPEEIIGLKGNLLKYLKDGRNILSEDNQGFTTAYFINPQDIEKFMSQFPLEKTVITGVEGLPAQSETKINALPDEVYNEWLDIITETATNPMTWATCEHFLYIGEKI